MLRRLIAGFARHRPVPLTIRAAKAAFRAAGWTINPIVCEYIEFFVLREGIPGQGVVLSPAEPTKIHLATLALFGKKNGLPVVVLCGVTCSPEIRAEASVRHIPLLEWPDLEGLADQVLNMRERAAKALADAKFSERARVPLSGRSRAVTLTQAQIAAGFFFGTEHVSGWFIPRAGERLLITFANWHSDPAIAPRWGEAYGALAGCSALGFETSELNWFPEEDMVQCIAAAAEILGTRFRRRVLLGASQGGYAALRYSRQLAADAVVAFSPQYSIDPAARLDQRFQGRYRSALHSGMRVRSGEAAGTLFAFHDPYDDDDRAHARQIHATTGATLIGLPFAGHCCGYVLAEPLSVVQILRHCEADEGAAARQVALQQRHTHTQRAYLMALYLSERRPATAWALFDRYRHIYPAQDWGNVCYRLAQSGFAAKVLDWAVARAEANPASAEHQVLAALVAIRVPDRHVALDFIGRARRMEPRNGKFLYIESLAIAAGQT